MCDSHGQGAVHPVADPFGPDFAPCLFLYLRHMAHAAVGHSWGAQSGLALVWYMLCHVGPHGGWGTYFPLPCMHSASKVPRTSVVPLSKTCFLSG